MTRKTFIAKLDNEHGVEIKTAKGIGSFIYTWAHRIREKGWRGIFNYYGQSTNIIKIYFFFPNKIKYWNPFDPEIQFQLRNFYLYEMESIRRKVSSERGGNMRAAIHSYTCELFWITKFHHEGWYFEFVGLLIAPD